MQKKFRIGIDVGGTKVAYGLFDSCGKILDRFQYPTDISVDGAAFSDEIITSVYSLIEKNNLLADQIKGVGICMPSYILFDTGYIVMTSAMTNIKNFAMRDYIEKRLPMRVVLDNDSNVAALAEHRHGAGRGRRHMVYIAASTGIGSGIIINEGLFRGSNGFAGECGHMLITPDKGLKCGCENQGCFMSYASGRYVCEHVKLKMKDGAKTILSDCVDLTAADILNAYNKNDAVAMEAVESMAHYLAICVFNVYQLLNIDLFVFGGGLVNFGDTLFGRVRKIFESYKHTSQPVTFKFAELEKDFGIVGAAELLAD